MPLPTSLHVQKGSIPSATRFSTPAQVPVVLVPGDAFPATTISQRKRSLYTFPLHIQKGHLPSVMPLCEYQLNTNPNTCGETTFWEKQVSNSSLVSLTTHLWAPRCAGNLKESPPDQYTWILTCLSPSSCPPLLSRLLFFP